ncbi:uncharacterized protein SCHCODRAFT_02586820 [Schizophyllum commune H4-8]|nr:uncharacterized protein SCHCODRAFT_02586820 [Schizophyllum commune H4-8]KAI5888124.1 hypothetical protein SCHCODRAFT_02586820 [Schizophyllum commune H4-8]
MHPYQPEGLTGAELATANKEQVKHWIRLTKKAAEADDTKIDLKLSGKVAELRARLAAFLGLDITNVIISKTKASAAVKTETTIDETIRAKQWEHWHVLGDEWFRAAQNQMPFRLQQTGQELPIARDTVLFKSICDVIAAFPLRPTDPIAPPQERLTNVSRQTVNLWIQAVCDGQDRLALVYLHTLRNLLYNMSEGAHFLMTTSTTMDDSPPTPGPVTPSHLPQLPISTSIASPTPLTRTSSLNIINNNALSTFPTPPQVLRTQEAMTTQADAAIANTSSVTLITLPTAATLQDAISQCESGLVARIRAAYGPHEGKKGTAANPAIWATYKVNITRRERLHSVLQEDFDGDKERFFAFFSKPDSHPKRGMKRNRATMEAQASDSTANPRVSFAVNQVVDAIPKCRADVKMAMCDLSAVERLDRWGVKNDFEIWRELGLERYGSR